MPEIGDTLRIFQVLCGIVLLNVCELTWIIKFSLCYVLDLLISCHFLYGYFPSPTLITGISEYLLIVLCYSLRIVLIVLLDELVR